MSERDKTPEELVEGLAKHFGVRVEPSPGSVCPECGCPDPDHHYHGRSQEDGPCPNPFHTPVPERPERCPTCDSRYRDEYGDSGKCADAFHTLRPEGPRVFQRGDTKTTDYSRERPEEWAEETGGTHEQAVKAASAERPEGERFYRHQREGDGWALVESEPMVPLARLQAVEQARYEDIAALNRKVQAAERAEALEVQRRLGAEHEKAEAEARATRAEDALRRIAHPDPDLEGPYGDAENIAHEALPSPDTPEDTDAR